MTSSIDPSTVTAVLQAAARAPSAHNAQPWRLTPRGEGRYLIWYAYADKLLADPDDRDGIMAVGGFYETLRLAAEHRSLAATFTPSVSHHEDGIGLGVIELQPLGGPPDPLASSIERRQCNRHRYVQAPLPKGLADGLVMLGNLLLEPSAVGPLVSRASVLSWRDRRFVSDLAGWTRFDDTSPDGMTFDCLRLNAFDVFALRVALALGRLPGWLAWCYAQRDVRLTRASGAMAVLLTDGRDPGTLFECGRRLIRSWTLINAAGFSWHPMSVVIDQATVGELGAMIRGRDPVAIYRVGLTPRRAAWSRRRPIEATIVAGPRD